MTNTAPSGVNTLDVDIGGTFTDAVLRYGSRLAKGKSLTTRHDLAIGFMRAAANAAHALDLSAEDAIASLDYVRYSTTLALNSLIERKGPKLGLIVTRGHEHVMLIGRARQWADGKPVEERRHLYRAMKPLLLIPPGMTVSVAERVDRDGRVLLPLDEEDAQQQIRYLLDQGAQGFVICTLWSFRNPVHERRIAELISEEIPDHYLGNVPVMLSSEVHPKWHEYPRANVTILNAYLQRVMAQELVDLSDKLRDAGYGRSLWIINNTGGVAKLYRTRAIDTFGAGPVAGVFGAAFFSNEYGDANVITADMGGTSFDYAVVLNGAPTEYDPYTTIDSWATEVPKIEVSSIGAGGGSVAQVNVEMGNQIEVGPESAGANPGPACYGLGGTRPTVTDADVVLRLLVPEQFGEGNLELDAAAAERALEAHVAQPLGIPVIEAAWYVRQVIDAKMGTQLKTELALRGLDSRNFVLYAFGGAGPVHACSFACHAGVNLVRVFPYSSVFSALGGTVIGFRRVYEASRRIPISLDDGTLISEACLAIEEIVASLEARATADVAGEELRGQLRLSLELAMKYRMQPTRVRVRAPLVHLESESDLEEIRRAFLDTFIEHYGSLATEVRAGIEIDELYLVAEEEQSDDSDTSLALQALAPGGTNESGSSLMEPRRTYWGPEKGWLDTTILDHRSVTDGEVISGPAIISFSDTTLVVDPAWEAVVDRHGVWTISDRGVA